jgi:hypothetical protein
MSNTLTDYIIGSSPDGLTEFKFSTMIEIKCPMSGRMRRRTSYYDSDFDGYDFDGNQMNPFYERDSMYRDECFRYCNGDFYGDEMNVFPFDDRYETTTGGFYELFEKVQRKKETTIVLNNYFPNDISDMIYKKIII